MMAMQKKLLLVLVLVMIVAQGCETSRSLRKEPPATLGDKIKQADTWISEHMW